MFPYPKRSSSIASLLLVAALGVSCLNFGEESSRFDTNAPSAVPTKTVANEHGEKYTLVRASINGHEPGWFMLASASYFCILDSGYVRETEGLSKVSEIEIPYPCKLPVTVYRSKSLEVGPLTIKNLDIAAFDLSELTATVEEEIIGILGYPLLAHSVVGIRYGEAGDDSVFVVDPKSFELTTGKWSPLGIYDFQPTLTCRVNRRDSAPFSISTGASGSVSFYSVFAANHDLLEGRPTTETRSTTVCGETIELEGAVRVFEIDGNTFEDVTVTVLTPGSISDVAPGRLGGYLGREFLSRFTVVFDVKNERIALIPE